MEHFYTTPNVAPQVMLGEGYSLNQVGLEWITCCLTVVALAHLYKLSRLPSHRIKLKDVESLFDKQHSSIANEELQ